MKNEYDEIMEKATFHQIVNFIKNGEPSEIDVALFQKKDSFHLLNEIEDAINAKLGQDEAENLISEISSRIFDIENLAFYQGMQAGVRLLKELMQI